MEKLPLSPHLQIYKMPLSAFLSIMHRVTGLVFVMAVIMISILLLMLSLGEGAWRSFFDVMCSLKVRYWASVLIFSVHYHAMNGIRFLIWSFGLGVNLKSSNLAGILTLIISFIMTILFYQFFKL